MATVDMTAVANRPGYVLDVPLVVGANAGNKRAVTSNVATMTTYVAHGLHVGDVVLIASCGDATYDGLRTVVAVPSTTTFTFALTHADEVETADAAVTFTPGSLVRVSHRSLYTIGPLGITPAGVANAATSYVLVSKAGANPPATYAEGAKFTLWALGGAVQLNGGQYGLSTGYAEFQLTAVGELCKVQIAEVLAKVGGPG